MVRWGIKTLGHVHPSSLGPLRLLLFLLLTLVTPSVSS